MKTSRLIWIVRLAMEEDSIQVLVCTYQGEQFIAQQLDSIVAQSYQSIEIHVFDDCSKDRTQEIVKEYCEKNPKIYLHINNQNMGFLKNFENAINNTSGDYIALSDQDDIWHPDKLKLSMREIKILEEKYPNTPAMVHTDLSLINDLGKTIDTSFFKKKKINIPPEKSLSRIMGHCGVMGNTILMNRLLVEKALPFPDGLKYHDYWLAVVNELFGIRKTLSDALVQYRIHRDNSSNNRINSSGVNKVSGINRDYLLPFMEDYRERPIQNLLESYKLTPDEETLIKQFYTYLNFEGGRLSNFIFLMKNNFLKDDFLYRLSVFFRIMLTNRYGKNK